MQTFKKYLNPLYKQLEDIGSFSDLTDLSALEQEEYPTLQEVTKKKIASIRSLLPRLDRLEEELEHQITLIETESDIDERKDAKNVYNQILKQIEALIGRINNELIALDSPYFGKIVFLPDDSKTGKPLLLYIGKFALVDEKTHIQIITDWRSPIANIYYENSGPAKNVSFQAPVGKRTGELKQKRQFQIARARIKGIYDAKSGNVAADEFLLAQLNERLGKKLQDIVSTIQAQQNKIIREDINHPSVIQGVAGSGKTTILLHRLAYLFYTYKETITSENSLIIAPNQMFIDYVSDVLPDLGISKVDTQTYLFWAKSFLTWGDNYRLSNLEEDMKIKEFKGSLEFLDTLDTYFDKFEKELLEEMPYSRKDIVANRYFLLKKNYQDIDMAERLELALEYSFAQKHFRKSLDGYIGDMNDNDFDIKKKVLTYFRNNTSVYRLYRNLFKDTLLNPDVCTYSLNGLVSEGKNNFFRIEDLAPMVYLYQKINGIKNVTRDTVMVDEAQDMSYIQLATLTKIAKDGNITLAGDLAQSIIPPFYIRSWDGVLDILERYTHKKVSFHQLQRCYRTTVEIIDYANGLFREKFPKSYQLPEAVLRHGDDVEILNIGSTLDSCSEKELKVVVEKIKEQFEKGAVTCSVLCRDKNHSTNIYNRLKSYNEYLDREVINYTENDYKQGLLVMPIENAKGLEFDSVFIADMDSYPDDELSWRLLYVGITRALHRLFIIK